MWTIPVFSNKVLAVEKSAIAPDAVVLHVCAKVIKQRHVTWGAGLSTSGNRPSAAVLIASVIGCAVTSLISQQSTQCNINMI